MPIICFKSQVATVESNVLQYEITELLPARDYTVTIETSSFETDPNGDGQITSSSSNSPSTTCQTGKKQKQSDFCNFIKNSNFQQILVPKKEKGFSYSFSL